MSPTGGAGCAFIYLIVPFWHYCVDQGGLQTTQNSITNIHQTTLKPIKLCKTSIPTPQPQLWLVKLVKSPPK